MARPGTVIGWKLPREERARLLGRFPPRYGNVVADHVTLKVGAATQAALPKRPATARIVGIADDRRSLECLVIELDGTTDRPDGSTYHITWSLGEGRKARESNDLLRDQGWEALASPIDLVLEPACFQMSRARLFLDLDGVLADFDEGARKLLGASPGVFQQRHGQGTFWKKLAAAGNFYGTLPEMADARVLFDGLRHLNPTILTGLPIGNWAAPQKVKWAEEHFPGVPVITCMARDKHKHMHPGDVLVDDRENHRSTYEAAGVVFVHHKNAQDSLMQLAKIFPSVKAPGRA